MTQPMPDKPMSALDEIFPKGCGEYFKACDTMGDSISSSFRLSPLATVCDAIRYHKDGLPIMPREFYIVAYDKYDANKEMTDNPVELARRRVRISLNVEVLDDQPRRGDKGE